MDYDVAVVGGGVSGLLSALALSKEGKKVVLLEREPMVGGVLRSYNIEGYRVDTGPHIITRLEHGPLKLLMDKYFEVTPIFVPHGRYFVRLGGMVRPFPWNLRDWLSFDLIPPVDRLYLVKTLFSASYLLGEERDLNNLSVAELIGSGISPETGRFLDCMCAFMTGGGSMAATPVARFIDAERYKSISEGYLDKLYNVLMKEGGTDQTYPKTGVQSIVDSIVTSIGGRADLNVNEEVTGIDIGEKSVELSTTKDSYTADYLVYSGFSSELPKLARGLPKDYAALLGRIKRISSMTVWLGLKKKVFMEQGSEIWADSQPYSWVVPTSNYDPGLAPKDHQLVGFAFNMPQGFDLEREKRRALDMIYQTVPGVEQGVDFTHVQALVPEKAVWAVGAQFADVKSPVDRLYLVGTDTEKRSMGVTRASYSVVKLLSKLEDDKKI
ncbi:MAG: FAD-dependent oxidoreductase [Candidatus Altiarchaeota archaeon]|nr:FAD-dependent oxidoreductase [Candidatus Altiarchaeota archaeon]